MQSTLDKNKKSNTSETKLSVKYIVNTQWIPVNDLQK